MENEWPSPFFRSRPENLVAKSIGLWICQVFRDLRKLVAMLFHFILTIVKLRPDVFCCDLFLQLHLISGRDMNSLS